MTGRLWRPSAWRRDALRTNLWLVPTVEVVIAAALFAATFKIDQGAYSGHYVLPSWVNNGSADAARQILIGIAAAVITVVGLVFSITIVALTLTSTQFGPRMLRNFIRDIGTQITLGTFVATFVYAALALGSISHGSRGDFVPHLSITLALLFVLASLGVLIYFIHHVAKSIQLPEVIASIARELAVAIDAEAITSGEDTTRESGPSIAELHRRLDEAGTAVAAPSSGYLQFVDYDDLVAIAAASDAVVRLLYRPGHFVVEGLPLATVWPAEAVEAVARGLDRAHFTGPHRTLAQDLSFAIDQIVEIAIRALSPAVNDTFTAMTCVDWLSDGLCKITASWNPRLVQRDARGQVRIIAADVRYERFVERSFDKIRQASQAMPAIMIRQLDALNKVMVYATTDEQRSVLRNQAEMILRSSENTVLEPNDRRDVRQRYDPLAAASARRET